MPDLGDWSWNGLAQNDWIALGLWLVAIELLGLFVWPLTGYVCRSLPDRGYPLCKTLVLVLVAWPVWMAASLHIVPFTVWSILAAIVLVAGISGLLWRSNGAELRAWMRDNRRLIAAWEAVFLVAFGFLLAIRLVDPDLWLPFRGGEKPMDFGFLNSTLRSAWMPPPDPFFSGGYINYYYYGQFIIACLIKLLGIPSAIGFNLALPLLYGLLVLGVGSVVYNAVAAAGRARRRTAFGWGLAGAGLVAVAGNLQTSLQLFSITAPGLYRPLLGLFHSWGLTAPAMSQLFTGFDYWPASRVAPRIIDEFPYWIFLLGDLHAHLISLPFQAAALGLAFSFQLSAFSFQPGFLAALRMTVIARLCVTALTLGTLAAINTWDFVTYCGIFAAMAMVAWLRQRRDARDGAGMRPPPLWAVAGGVGLLIGLALLAYAPFFMSLQAFYNQILPITGAMRRTHLAEWLVIWGLFAFIVVSYVVIGLRRYRTSSGVLPHSAGIAVLVVAGLGVLVCLFLAQWLIALLTAMLGGLLAVQIGGARERGLLFGGLLLTTATALTLGVELFYVADFQQNTEWFRLNTVFKFYMQAWLLFGCGSAIALYYTVRALKPLWLTAFALLLAGSLVFVVVGTPSRLAEKFAVRPSALTLNGTAFMDGNSFVYGPVTNTVTVNLRDDRQAYDWLIAHSHGFPVIATAPTPPDAEGMLVATYTGLPVVVGSQHQEEQRYPQQVAARRADMAELFRTSDPARAVAILRKYNASYIYLGPYERAVAHDAPGGLAKFAAMTDSTLEVAYRNEGVTLYRVRAP